jgi:hypothetical protein
MAFDSTGLKVYGEGEWKVRQDRISKRRTWRKIDLEVDVTSGEIICVTVTTNDSKDRELFPSQAIEEVCLDGAYGTKNCCDVCMAGD